MWRTYVADLLCLSVSLRTKRKSIPFYSDIVSRTSSNYDSRSGQEIVNEIIAKRRRGRKPKVVNENEAV